MVACRCLRTLLLTTSWWTETSASITIYERAEHRRWARHADFHRTPFRPFNVFTTLRTIPIESSIICFFCVVPHIIVIIISFFYLFFFFITIIHLALFILCAFKSLKAPSNHRTVTHFCWENQRESLNSVIVKSVLNRRFVNCSFRVYTTKCTYFI